MLKRALLVSVALGSLACGTAQAPAPEPTPDPHRLPSKQKVSLPTGVEMAYFELGAARGETLLFLHGLTDSSRSFHATMVHLTRLRPGLRLVAVDQRGHGASSMPDPERCRDVPEECFRPADYAADAIALLDHLGVETATLVGHSMGSMVSQEIALSHPERVARVVLVATSPGGELRREVSDFLLGGLIEGPWKAAVEAQGRAFPGDAYEMTPLDVDPNAEQWMADNWVTEPLADPALLAAIAPETARVKLGTWIGATRAVLGFDNRERLKGLSVPAFVAWGTQDTLTDKGDQDRLLAALDAAAAAGRARYVWKQYGERPVDESTPPDDVAHNLPWAVPEALAEDIAAFLETGSPTADLVFGKPGGGLETRADAAVIKKRPDGDAAPGDEG